MKRYQLKISDSNMIGYLSFINLLFMVAPIYSIGLQIILILHSKTKNEKIFQNLILSVSILLGVINTTKVLESDLVNYIAWYKLAAHMSFYDYILMSGKEYLYNAVVYVISSVTGNNQNAFIMLTTFLGYFLILNAILRLTVVSNAPTSLILLVIIALGFFPPLFNISAQVIRQFLAGALLSVFLVNRIIQGKNNWLLFLGALLIHSSVLLFLPFILSPLLNRPPKVFVLVIALLGMLILMEIVAPWLGIIAKNSDLPTISYIGSRMSQTKFYSLGSLGMQIYVLIIMSVGLIYFKTYIYKCLPGTIYPQGYFLVSNLIIVLSGFIIFTSIQNSTSELAGRFTFYLYIIVPIIAVISIYKKAPSTLVSVLLAILMLTYFLYNLSFGVWTYKNILDLLVLPIFSYF